MLPLRRKRPQPTESATQQPDSVTPSSPLAIHVGDADLLFGGFIDATAIRRTSNTGSGLGTSFGTIPFGNTVQGHMNDTQFSSQNSRLTLQATSKVGTANLKGVLEVDFLGNAPNGLNVTTNSNTLRMRVFWGQYRQGAFEFLAGQAWSLMTPNRNGLSPETGGRVLQPDRRSELSGGTDMGTDHAVPADDASQRQRDGGGLDRKPGSVCWQRRQAAGGTSLRRGRCWRHGQ